jgi:hypothetical protein
MLSQARGILFWIFEVLNMQADDDFDDVFPGSGAVTRAWESWKRQPKLPLDYAS